MFYSFKRRFQKHPIDTVIVWITTLLMLSLIIVSLVAYLFRFYDYGLSFDSTDFGIFGDYVGGVIGTIVAIYGAFYVYQTYRQQENQSTLQQFENTFFQLLSQQRDIIKNLKGKIGTKDYLGYEYLHALHEELMVPMEDPEISNLTKKNLRYKVNDFYTELFREHTYQLGHYFRHIYHILKYIETSFIEEERKKGYADFLQAQMTTDELYLLALNGVSEYGWKKARPLIDNYSLLENLSIENDDAIFRIIKCFYPKTQVKQGIQTKENIVFVGGVHGVGKTYFVENLPKDIKKKIKTLSCSEIMGWDKTSKAVIDTNENQKRLIFNLRDEIEEDKKYFLVGHFCLVNKKSQEIEQIPIDTFRAINPHSLILINETPEIIIKRLEERGNVDKWRVDFIKKFVDAERKHAEKVKNELGIKLYIYESSVLGNEVYKKVKNDLINFLEDD